MLLQLAADLRQFLYETFVAKLDFWLLFGIAGQLLFTGRFLVQWLASEKAGRSVVPVAFWFFSIGGGLMTLIYGIVRREPIIIMGQGLALFIYARNLMLIDRERRRSRLDDKA